MGGAHRTPAFQAMNPGMAVAVLAQDDGTFVFDCTAITEYIDASIDGPSLTGKTPKERALIHTMQRRAESFVMDAVGTCFHQTTDGFGPAIEGDQCEGWGMRQKGIAANGMQYFDELLAKPPSVGGEHFPMADVARFMGLGFADVARVDVPASCANLADRRHRGARPGVTTVLGD